MNLKSDYTGFPLGLAYISAMLKSNGFTNTKGIDLGIDSLTRVELGLGLEALLSLTIPDEVLYDVSTVRDVIMRIQEIIQNSKPHAAKVIQKSWGEILREKPKEEILQKLELSPGL